jgi:hypothetical protein
MLSGNAAERRSRWDVGDDVRGCNLQPGPDSSYLDGAEMRGIGRDCGWKQRGNMGFQVWLVCYAPTVCMVMLLPCQAWAMGSLHDASPISASWPLANHSSMLGPASTLAHTMMTTIGQLVMNSKIRVVVTPGLSRNPCQSL